MERICQYNEGVSCDRAKCYHCGWDPEVAQKRQEEFIKEMYREKLYKVPFTGHCEVWAMSPEEAADKAEDISKQFFAQYDYGDPICLEEEDEDELD